MLNTLTKTPRRLDLDCFRGVAILAVLLIHLSGHFLPRLAQDGWAWIGLAAVNRALQFAVPAFLMVSAFLYTRKLHQNPNPLSTVVNRFFSIFCLYLVWSMIGVTMNYLGHWEDLGGRHFLKILLYGRGFYHLYFLVLMLQMIVLLPLIIPLFKRINTWVALAAITIGLQLGVYIINKACIQFEFIGSSIFWYVLPISLGMWLALDETRLLQLRQCNLVPLLILTAVGFGLYSPMALSALQNGTVNTFLFQISEWMFTSGMCLLLFSRIQSLQSKSLATLGERSFAIYIAHPFVILALDGILTPMRVLPAMTTYLGLCLAVPMLPNLVAPLFFRSIDYLRSLKWVSALWRRALLGMCMGVTVTAAASPSAGTPLLRQLIHNGWSPNSNLSAQITPIAVPDADLKTIVCDTVQFTSHWWHGQPVRIFAFYAYPKTMTQKIPALLLVHGGGGYATQQRVIEGAQHGFATLSIDLPGKGTNREKFLRSTGPDMTVPQIFTVTPNPSESYIYHAVIAEMRAITFLSQRPEVDPKRIGLVGASWGGATGLITTSLDKRVKCFVDIFGSGYVDEGSCWGGYFATMPPGQFATWERNYDAARYLNGIHVPVLGVAATNDSCYWLPQFFKTMHNIHPTPDLICLPNLNHKISHPAHDAFYRWLQRHLIDPENAPIITAQRLIGLPTGLRASLQIRAVHPTLSVTFSYATATAEGSARRHWNSVPGIQTTPGHWTAMIPADANTPLYFFSTVAFADSSLTSSSIHTGMRLAGSHFHGALEIPDMNRMRICQYAALQNAAPKEAACDFPLMFLILIDFILAIVVVCLPKERLPQTTITGVQRAVF